MATLRITLFGSPQVFRAGERVTGFITSKAQALFYYLVVTRRAHTRTALAGLLWPEANDSQAKKNLRDILPNLRVLLGPYLVITRDQLKFNEQSSHWVDITEFYSHLTPGYTEDATALQKAITLYQGDFLDGFYIQNAPEFETWVRTQREQLRALCVQGLHTLVSFYLAHKRYNEGLTFTNRLLMLEPWDEHAHRQQMLLLALSGQRSAALAQYTTCRRLLMEHLNVEPAAQTITLYEQIRAEEISPNEAEGQATPYVISSSALMPTLHNLPRPLTSLIDRVDDLAHIQQKVLNPAYPLVTLVGEGGIGKTRLALATAEQVMAKFTDGVWFVPLVGVSAMPNIGEQLAGAIGAALKLTFTGTAPLQVQLQQRLQNKSLLLILDNFEQLTAGAIFLLELLQTTQTIKILVTSRERLNLYGEYVYRLDGLPVPDPENNEQFENHNLLAYPAIQLFIERAERTMSGFRLTSANQADVVRICRFVEGLPLGIELAAALLEQHTCAEIAAALALGYTILNTDLVGMAARHQSIRAVLAYSWQFLTETEATILARCSIFRGGFTTEAAAAVTGASPLHLQRLLEQSLLRQPEPGRFEMHELVRWHAAEQWQAHPEEEQRLHQRHSLYYANLLQTLQTHPVTKGADAQELQRDLGNLRVVWNWVVAQGQWAFVEERLIDLFALYHAAGYYQEAASMATYALTQLRQHLQNQTEATLLLKRTLAKLLLQKADVIFRLGHIVSAEQLAREALHLGKQLGQTNIQAEAYWHLGWIEFRRAHWIAATDRAEKSLQLAQQSSHTQLEARVLNLLGICWNYRRTHSKARTHLLHALTLAQQLQAYTLESTILINLGEHYAMFGEYPNAFHYFQQARAVAETHQYREDIGVVAYNLANLFQMLGDWITAERHFEEALSCLSQIGETYYASLVYMYWGNLYSQRGNNETAISYCQRAQQQCRLNGYYDIEPRAWNQLGKAWLQQKRFPEAEAAYRQVLSLTTKKSSQTDQWLAQAGLAQIYLERHQLAQAMHQVEALAPFLAAPHLDDPYEEPFGVLWTCYCVLKANRDLRSQAVLQLAHRLLTEQAFKLDNQTLRRSFLENVPVHRAIVEAVQTGSAKEKRITKMENRQHWLCAD